MPKRPLRLPWQPLSILHLEYPPKRNLHSRQCKGGLPLPSSVIVGIKDRVRRNETMCALVQFGENDETHFCACSRRNVRVQYETSTKGNSVSGSYLKLLKAFVQLVVRNWRSFDIGIVFLC